MMVWLIAGIVLRRLLRSKLLGITLVIAILIFALLSSSLLMLRNARSAGDTEVANQLSANVILSALALMGFFACLVGLANGVTVIRREIREGTIFSVLSKPLTRAEYLLGSYIGSLVYLSFVWIIFGLLYLGLVYLTRQPMGKLLGLILLARWVYSVLMMSVAFFLALRFNAWIAVVLSVVVYNADSLYNIFPPLLRLVHVELPDWVKGTVLFLFPSTNSLDVLFESLLKARLNPAPVQWAFLSLIDYCAIMVLLAWVVFRRQELSPSTE
ncbi:MAG: ABC transporter permease [Acidobacteriia bacterium]|nr:ABC transporter permease [Terriglobia bacterium]